MLSRIWGHQLCSTPKSAGQNGSLTNIRYEETYPDILYSQYQCISDQQHSIFYIRLSILFNSQEPFYYLHLVTLLFSEVLTQYFPSPNHCLTSVDPAQCEIKAPKRFAHPSTLLEVRKHFIYFGQLLFWGCIMVSQSIKQELQIKWICLMCTQPGTQGPSRGAARASSHSSEWD